MIQLVQLLQAYCYYYYRPTAASTITTTTLTTAITTTITVDDYSFVFLIRTTSVRTTVQVI